MKTTYILLQRESQNYLRDDRVQLYDNKATGLEVHNKLLERIKYTFLTSF